MKKKVSILFVQKYLGKDSRVQLIEKIVHTSLYKVPCTPQEALLRRCIQYLLFLIISLH